MIDSATPVEAGSSFLKAIINSVSGEEKSFRQSPAKKYGGDSGIAIDDTGIPKSRR
jgi:hypothetical protein